MTQQSDSFKPFIFDDHDTAPISELVARWNELAEGLLSEPSEELSIEADKCSEDALRTPIAFGTAGLRGRMAAGYAHMNSVVVAAAARGLSAWLRSGNPPIGGSGVVIGFDARRLSRRFAEVTAAAFLADGWPSSRVFLFPSYTSTPQLATSVGILGTSVGVMITASHNPAADNGFKVYAANTAQIISPIDVVVASAIRSHGRAPASLCELLAHVASERSAVPLPDGAAAVAALGATDASAQALRGYLSHAVDVVRSLTPEGFNVLKHTTITYTPLHGVGAQTTQKLWSSLGWPAMVATESQMDPDSSFPTTPFPNPEEGQGVLAEAFAAADKVSSNTVFAHDPDADRLGIAERVSVEEPWHVFSGNDIALLLCDAVLSSAKRAKASGDASAVSRLVAVYSSVSSRILSTIAAAEGFAAVETLTGFKWMGNAVADLVGVPVGATRLAVPGKWVPQLARARDTGSAAATARQLLVAFEVEIGFLVGHPPGALDKDGILTSAVMWQHAQHLYSTHGSGALRARCEQLHATYGHHIHRTSYFITPSPSVRDAIFFDLCDNQINRDGSCLRGRSLSHYPLSFGPFAVTGVRNLCPDVMFDSTQEGGTPTLPQVAGNMMVTFYFDSVVLTVRGSGTEPKVKWYAESVSKDKTAAEQLVSALTAAFFAWLEPERRGLRAKK